MAVFVVERPLLSTMVAVTSFTPLRVTRLMTFSNGSDPTCVETPLSATDDPAPSEAPPGNATLDTPYWTIDTFV